MKLYCDADCTTCYHQRSKDIYTHGKEHFYFCRNCRMSFLCAFPLKRKIGLKKQYICPTCGRTLVELPLWRAYQLGLTTKIVPRISRGTILKNTWKEMKDVDTQNLITYQLRRERLKFDHEITEGELQKKISYLKEYPSLNTSTLLEILLLSDLDLKKIDFSGSLEDILNDIALFEPYLIFSFYETLKYNRIENYFSLLLMLMVNKAKFNTDFISCNVSEALKGTIDLYSIDKTSNISWYVISEESMEENQLSALLNEILSLHPLNFANLKSIYFVSKKFSWTAKKIIEKQNEIYTRFGTVNLNICQIEGNNKIKFHC